MVSSLLPPPTASLIPNLLRPFSRRAEQFPKQKRSPATVDFFLVIPAFKESARLPAFLKQLVKQLRLCRREWRVLVVDDGSGVGEQEKLLDLLGGLSAKQLIAPLLLSENTGKGGAVRAGWEHADDAKYLAFVDADGAISAGEVCRLLDEAFHSDNLGAVFGSRVKMLGKKVERGFLRHLTGRLFAFLVGVLITPSIYDSQCGIKVIPASAYRKIKNRLQENGFCFDVELLAALLDSNVPIREVPIDWQDQPGSKVFVIRDTLRLLSGLWRIRRRRGSWT